MKPLFVSSSRFSLHNKTLAPSLFCSIHFRYFSKKTSNLLKIKPFFFFSNFYFIPMEIPVFTSFRLSYSSAVSLRSCSSKYSIFFHGCFFRGKRLSIRWNIYSSKPCMGIKASLENNSLSNGVLGKAKTEVNSGDFWGHSEFVEVIGIGSRRDAVLNFCLESQFKSSSLRFW